MADGLSVLMKIVPAAIWVLLYHSPELKGNRRLVLEIVVLTLLFYLPGNRIPEPYLSLLSVALVCVLQYVLGRNAPATARTLMTFLETKAILILGFALAYVVITQLFGYHRRYVLLVSMAVEIGLTVLILHCDRRYQVNTLMQNKPLTIVLLLLFTLPYSIIKHPYNINNLELNRLSLFFSVSLFCLIGLWMYDNYTKQKAIRETQKLVDELIRTAHKYRSLTPSVMQMIKTLWRQSTESNEGSSSSTYAKALEELERLNLDIGVELQSQYIQEQQFQSTGILLLDNQLLNEQCESMRSGINLEVIVKDPIPAEQNSKITLLEFQRMIGDLLYNAQNAVHKSLEIREILLVFGYVNGVFSIKVSDSGPLFPPSILNHIGERGATDGGTGHGYADLLEFLHKCRGSLTIEEYTPEETIIYTKSISILFDGLEKVKIVSGQPAVRNETRDVGDICQINAKGR